MCNIDPVKAIDDILDYINHDTYYLTRDQQSAIEWRLKDVQSYIKEIYARAKKCQQ